MPDKKIVRGFEPVLQTPTQQFDFQNPPFDPTEFSKELGQIMLDNGGVGISACQIDVPYAVFAMRAVPMIVCFNPKIVDYSGNVTPLYEGCLSFPGVALEIKRHDRIRLRYQEPSGEMQLKTFEGYTAHVVQHEVDHLSGTLFFDRVSRLKANMAIKRAKKLGFDYISSNLIKGRV